MSTNLKCRAGERQRKRESSRQASEAQREIKGRQRSRARDKKQRSHFFVGRTTWKFCSGGNKMGNASDHQCKVIMSGSERKSEQENVRLRSFWKFHVVVVQNNGKETYKKVCCTCKVAFLLIRPTVVVHRSPALPSPLSITRFHILFEQTIK